MYIRSMVEHIYSKSACPPHLKSSDLSVSPDIRKTRKLLSAWITLTSATDQLATALPGTGQAIANPAAKLKLKSIKFSRTKFLSLLAVNRLGLLLESLLLLLWAGYPGALVTGVGSWVLLGYFWLRTAAVSPSWDML